MNSRLEDALRSTFDADVAAEPDRFAERVRTGVRRRQQVRRTVVATAVVAVLAGAGVVGLTQQTGGDGDPSPTERITDTNGLTPPPVRPSLLEVAGESLYTLSQDPACDCGRVHRLRDGRWSVLGEVPDWLATGMGFEPDGQHGWITATGAAWSSDDGGRTWTTIPAITPGPLQANLAVTSSGAFLLTEREGLVHLTAGEDQPTAVPVPGIDRAGSIHAIGEVLLVTEDTDQDLSGTPVMKVSEDGGASWTALDAPCAGAWPIAAGDAVFLTCRSAAGMQVERWRPGQDRFELFADLVASRDDSSATVPFDAERLFLKAGDDERVITNAQEADVTTYLAAGDNVRAAAALDDHLYLATYDAFIESTDGGRSWHPVR